MTSLSCMATISSAILTSATVSSTPPVVTTTVTSGNYLYAYTLALLMYYTHSYILVATYCIIASYYILHVCDPNK